VDELRQTYEGTRVGRQELEGELIFDLSGTLVSFEDIEKARVLPEELPEVEGATETERILSQMQRVIIGVDPAGSYGDDSDETGIVVCAKGNDTHGYVLEDASGKYSPKAWASRVDRLYEKWHAGLVVAEVNVGNNLVEEVVRSVRPTIRFKPVRALTGKLLRAEPVTALYEQGRIHHVGTFVKLEDQLVTFTPEKAMKHTRGNSPDRMDAMVHAFTELGLARFGPGAGFRQFLEVRRQRDAEGSGETRQLARHLSAKEGRTERAQERRMARCKHRWKVQPDGTGYCIMGCGAEMEPTAPSVAGVL
jgi:predicted phage terminase large subunit-like protein